MTAVVVVPVLNNNFTVQYPRVTVCSLRWIWGLKSLHGPSHTDFLRCTGDRFYQKLEVVPAGWAALYWWEGRA